MEKKYKRPFPLIKQKDTAKLLKLMKCGIMLEKKNKNCGFGLAWQKQKHLLLNLKMAGFVMIWLTSKEKRFAIQNL